MKDKEIEQAVFEIIRQYGNVLKSSTRRTFIIPESRLPHSKKTIGNAIRVALLMVDDEDMKMQLKSAYISLANFVSDKEAKELEEIPKELFSFLEMDKDKKKANEIIDSVKKLQKKCEQINARASNIKGDTATAVNYIAESIRRTGEYSGGISELLINQLMND